MKTTLVIALFLIVFCANSSLAGDDKHIKATDHLIKTGVISNNSLTKNEAKIQNVEVTNGAAEIAAAYYIVGPNDTKAISSSLLSVASARDDDGGLATSFPGLNGFSSQREPTNSAAIKALQKAFDKGASVGARPVVDITVPTISGYSATFTTDFNAGVDTALERE